MDSLSAFELKFQLKQMLLVVTAIAVTLAISPWLTLTTALTACVTFLLKQARPSWCNRKIVFTSGLILFALSLALPVVRHGKIVFGIECLFFSSILVFSPDGGPRGTFTAVLAHLACLISGVMILLNLKINMVVGLAIAGLVALNCVIAIYFPYHSFEKMFFGYYIWLSSLVLMSAALFFAQENRLITSKHLTSRSDVGR